MTPEEISKKIERTLAEIKVYIAQAILCMAQMQLAVAEKELENSTK